MSGYKSGHLPVLPELPEPPDYADVPVTDPRQKNASPKSSKKATTKTTMACLGARARTLRKKNRTRKSIAKSKMACAADTRSLLPNIRCGRGNPQNKIAMQVCIMYGAQTRHTQITWCPTHQRIHTIQYQRILPRAIFIYFQWLIPCMVAAGCLLAYFMCRND